MNQRSISRRHFSSVIRSMKTWRHRKLLVVDAAWEDRAQYNHWRRKLFATLGLTKRNMVLHDYERFYERKKRASSHFEGHSFVEQVEMILDDPASFKWKDSDPQYSLLDFSEENN